MRSGIVLAAAVALMCTGCARSMSNRSFVRESVAKLPSGDEIAVESEFVERFAERPIVVPAHYVWRRATAERLMRVEGQGEMRMREVARVLTVKGDEKAWFQTRRRDGAQPEVRVSADGDRAWLVSEGRAVASFDYQTGVAIFGEAEQPACYNFVR
jgi:hypothetical protein